MRKKNNKYINSSDSQSEFSSGLPFYKNRRVNKKQIISQILLKYFSIKSGNDNKELEKEINYLVNKLKGSGLRIS